MKNKFCIYVSERGYFINTAFDFFFGRQASYFTYPLRTNDVAILEYEDAKKLCESNGWSFDCIKELH